MNKITEQNAHTELPPWSFNGLDEIQEMKKVERKILIRRMTKNKIDRDEEEWNRDS